MEKRIKSIDLMDLNDTTLMKLLEFDAYDCDEVIFNYNQDITYDEIREKTLYLSNIQYELLNLLNNCKDFYYDEEKHNNLWIKVEYDKDNLITSTNCNEEKISKIILLLSQSDEIDDICDNIIDPFVGLIQSYFDSIFLFRKNFINEDKLKNKRYFNYNYDLVVNKFSNSHLVETERFINKDNTQISE